MKTDIPIPDCILTNMEKNKKMIEDHNNNVKQQEKYVILKRQLESYKESKPLTSENIKDQQAVRHFETMVETINEKINQKKKNIEILINQEKEGLAVLERKLNHATSSLKNAQIRSITMVKRSKDEIKAMKEIQDLIREFKLKNPGYDLEHYLPGYKTFLDNSLYTPTPSGGMGYTPPVPSDILTPLPKIQETVESKPPCETVENKDSTASIEQMVYPNGEPEKFKFGKRRPNNSNLQDAIQKQNEQQGFPIPTFQTTTTSDIPQHPKIIKITKKVKKPTE